MLADLKPDAPRILDIWSHIEPRFGGVGPAASALASAVGRCSGMQMHQVAICDQLEQKRADGIDVRVRRIETPSMRGVADFRLREVLKEAVVNSDICHIHGMWLPHSLAARWLSTRSGKPMVSSVHGMLERWELRNKRLKKSFYSWLFERPSLSRSSCLRALSDREVGDYRRFGSRAPICLIPNGIGPLEPVDTRSFVSRFPELAGKSIILFLGRVHHKKGVLNLLQAWKTVVQQHGDAHLVIAGPECEDTGFKVRQIINEHGTERSVTLTGVINGDEKLAALSSARYFCLPSFSEGLSVAVLEALSIGLPPVITPECNMPSVASNGAGWVTANEPSALAQTLISCLDASPRDWQDMSLAARRLARSEFSWEAIAKNMSAVYGWLLGGPKPACVIA